MTNDRLALAAPRDRTRTVSPTRESAPSRLAATSPRARISADELQRIAELPAEDIVARLDPELAKKHFRAILEWEEEDEAERAAAAAAERYRALALSWDEPGPGSPESAMPELPVECGGLEVFEVSGTIKWFDAQRGYGFIVPDNGLADILLHVTCLRAGGYQTAHEGARIHCQVLRRPKGMQAFRILSMDNSTAIHPSLLPARTQVRVEPASGWERAVVKWFNRVRGFGFLSLGEAKPDIYVHMETLRRFGFTGLAPGQALEVRWGMGSKGMTAAELRPADPAQRDFSVH